MCIVCIPEKCISKLILIESDTLGQRANIVGKELALYVENLGLVPGTPQVS